MPNNGLYSTQKKHSDVIKLKKFVFVILYIIDSKDLKSIRIFVSYLSLTAVHRRRMAEIIKNMMNFMKCGTARPL